MATCVARYDELAMMEENGDKGWENVPGEDGQESSSSRKCFRTVTRRFGW
ncbi:hypothetical protein [Sinosporangium siamense]|uniref:Uncharacterized protein n=1 Tax=Sinosporangium siamense TaxID=1367973 RepID=A0A919RPR1_9ACTN|nr:hypothetical protein [Sinosporangium siamense]GII97017.1 hypothetical protein Ssi02_72480 [Sinosporangium siamense]